MIEKQKLIAWMSENGYDFHKGSYDSWLKEFHKFVDSSVEKCQWTEKSFMPEKFGDNFHYETSCKNFHNFEEGDLSTHDEFKYCPFCRGEIEEVESE